MFKLIKIYLLFTCKHFLKKVFFMLFFNIFIVVVFLCWGSFLNVIAYRSVHDKKFLQKRSKCNYCNKLIAWYDNIPVISWVILRSKCRKCKTKISVLYPFIEIFTCILLTSLFFYIFYVQNNFVFTKNNIISFLAYFIFFSALIVATRTDLEEMVIPQIFSIWLVPLGFIFSYLNILEISFISSFMGAVIGYGILWLVAKLFKLFTKKDGLGEGDMELLALIGAFTGIFGVWVTIFLSSLIGVLVAGIYLYTIKNIPNLKIPFGPFLVLGVILYFFFKSYFIDFIFYYSMPF